MYFSQMIACEADQYTDTEFLSAMNDVITMEASYVLEASYSISAFFSRIWRLISGIFKFIYKAIAAVISFIRVKILGKPANREVTIRPVSTDNDGRSKVNQIKAVASAIYNSTNKVKVPIDLELFKKESEFYFVHLDDCHFKNVYYSQFTVFVSRFLSKLEYHYSNLDNIESNYSFADFCNEADVQFLTQITDIPPNKIIYTEAIKENEIDQEEYSIYWDKVDIWFSSLSSFKLPGITKDLDEIKYYVEEYKNTIDLVTTKFPGVIDGFLKFINMISLHFNQFKNVVAELSRVIMSNTNIFKPHY